MFFQLKTDLFTLSSGVFMIYMFFTGDIGVVYKLAGFFVAIIVVHEDIF